MQLFADVLSLPPSLLLLIATVSDLAASEKQWPYNLPPHVKYFPEDEVHIKSIRELQGRLATQVPPVVRKMKPDEGEMFFFDYWQFDAVDPPQLSLSDGSGPALDYDRSAGRGNHRARLRLNLHEAAEIDNATDFLFPPFPLHVETSLHQGSIFQLFRRDLMERDFKCPTGTNDCSSIGRPNNCCDTDETCVIVTDTGNGDVGCCPSGSTCGSQVSSCDTDAGYTSCPGSPNGGCCIPGFACQDIGCVASSTLTTTTTLPVATVTTGESSTTTSSSSSSPPPPSSTSTSSSVPAGTPIPVPTSPTSTSSSSSSSVTAASVTTTTASPTATCSTGFQSCPATLGGGCCPTDRACGSPNCPPLPSSTESSTGVTAVPPVRPTSDTTEAPSVTTTASSSESFVGCPTGFYACSAYYPGGCCRVGRDCASTSCPSLDSTTPVSGSMVTVAAGAGTCASGWFSCAADVGGGCCPNGYNCGASCTATASGASNQQVGKMAPNAASAAVLGWGFLVTGCVFGIGMLFL